MTGSFELTSPLSILERGSTSPGETVQQHFDRLSATDVPIVCLLNGEPFLRKNWQKTVTIFDSLQFVTLPQGGGFKKVIGAVAAIALAIVAPYAAPLIGAAFGVTSAIGISLITAGIIIGGNLLINALLPPSVPGGQAQETFNSSPTYSLSAQGNQARLLQPIPRLYGRHILYPDFASQPYSSFEGNDQFLYQLFSLGVGTYNVEELRIEDTKMWDSVNGFSSSFSDVELEVVEPGQTMTLFPAAVTSSIEVGGQEMFKFNETRQVNILDSRITFSGSGDNKLQNIAVGDSLVLSNTASNDGIYTVVEVDGAAEWVEVTPAFPSSATNVSVTIETTSLVGPFVANPADKDVDKLSVDFVLNRGLYYANDQGGLNQFNISVRVEARLIDNIGDPLGAWSILGEHNYIRETATPQRITESYDVTLGRYEVRVQRITHKQSDSRYGNDIVWGGLRAFTPDDSTFSDTTLLAVKIRASNQLTDGASRRFNVIQSAKIPIWDGTNWSEPVVTKNPAWAAADILRNSVYGAGLADSRIDLSALLSLANTWDARGDEFNGIFDTKRSVWDALSAVLRSGRAQPLMIAGKVSFVRDEPAELVRGMLTPRNIRRGSFETTHILYDENTPDSVIVEFLDERSWKQNEVVCSLEGSQESNPARIRLFGVTSRTQAWREGMYQSAVNIYRRLFSSLSLEMEGRMLIRGDSVVVSHDLPQWGNSAEVVDWDLESKTLTVSEPLAGSVIGFSDQKGRLWGPINIEEISDDGLTITLDSISLDAEVLISGEIPINLDLTKEPTRVSSGTLESYSKRFKVVSTRPVDLDNVSIVLTHDDERVYSADTGLPPPEVDPFGPGVIPDAPQLNGLVISQNPGSQTNPVTLDASWQPASGATNYIVQVSTDNVTWRTVYTGQDSFTQFTEQAGAVYVRAAAIGTLRGNFTYPDPNPQVYGTPSSSPATPAFVTASADVNEGVVEVSWTQAARAETYDIEIFSEGTTAGIYDQLRLSKSVNGTFAQFTSSAVQQAGGPWPAFKASVTGVNSTGSGAPRETIVNDILLPPPTNISLTTAYSGVELNLDWTGVAAASSYFVEVIANGTTVGSYRVSNPVLLISNQELIAMGGPWRDFNISVKSESGMLTSGAAILNVVDLAPSIVTNVISSSTSIGEVNVSWDSITGDPTLTGYKVFASETSGFTPSIATEVFVGTATSFNVSGLVSGSTVFIIVSAIDTYAGQDGYNYSTEISQVVL